MVDQEQIAGLQSIIQAAESVLVIFSATADADLQGSVIALTQLLSSAGKNPRILTPHVQESYFFAELQKAQTQLGQDNLIISLPYSAEKVDKVSYHISEEDQRFYLTIRPKQGSTPLSTEEVEFTYAGASADAIIILGITTQSEMEQLYFGYEELFASVPTLVITEGVANFGTHHFETSSYSSICEAVAQLIHQAEYTLSPDAATALLYGIEQRTKMLQSLSATAETFETVAHLLHAGARRVPHATEKPQASSEEIVVPNVSKNVKPKVGRDTPKKK